MKPLTQEWVEKAEGDFQVAVQIMRRRKQRVYDAACFHAQQTVEKYFKARLCETGVVFPKTHDLAVLLKLLLPAQPLWSAFLPQTHLLEDFTRWISGTPATRRLWLRPGWLSNTARAFDARFGQVSVCLFEYQAELDTLLQSACP
jgi:hypothetical protein